MTVGEAREAARRWMVEEAPAISGFLAAYTAGSANWLPAEADLPAASDVDIMVVLSGASGAGGRRKFRYGGALLEVTFLSSSEFGSPGRILGDYHLAPSFRMAQVVFDPSGILAALQDAVSRDYARPSWVRRRCAHARDKVVAALRVDDGAPFPDQVMACLFAAGITTHILLVAGLRNPTVRSRYEAVRDLLADYGRLGFHETLLELLGSARMTAPQVDRCLAAAAEIFDRAAAAPAAPFAFASDVTAAARPVAIGGSLESVSRGCHREAMFWIAVTHTRCWKILAATAPDELPGFKERYRDLAAALGLPEPGAIRRRVAKIEQALPRVCAAAEEIIAANPEIRERSRRFRLP